MRVYLAVPLATNRNLAFARSLHDAIKAVGHDVTSDYVVKDDHDEGLGLSEVFERDTSRLMASDVIVADITEPSIGIGIELGFAHLHGKPIFLLMPRGKHSSVLALGLPKATKIEYESEDEAAAKLKVALRS